ncbi:MAG: hypothetical protein GF363_01205, partial [Chitinivibrionales bacterium]|nr:hypothetical protein [Chitinivibrionales bacterium]
MVSRRSAQCMCLSVLFVITFAALVTVNRNDSLHVAIAQSPDAPTTAPTGYSGSSSCRPCHENFYKLWEDSFHGLAMQPFTAQFAESNLTPQKEPVTIGEYRYRADLQGAGSAVIERGPDGEKRYPMVHVLGGKYIYYFLTPLDRGRLQVLPVAYDVRQKEWFNTTASMVRHAAEIEDAPLHWTARPLTFNTACFSCHVSQLSTNYRPENDSYQTTWTEPGINCETCHGPGEAHVRVCEEAPPGVVPEDMKIIDTTVFTPAQNNAMCAP